MPMIKKSVQKQIDAIIKEIWMKNIPKDYKEDYLINEDCLKMATAEKKKESIKQFNIENSNKINEKISEIKQRQKKEKKEC